MKLEMSNTICATRAYVTLFTYVLALLSVVSGLCTFVV